MFKIIVLSFYLIGLGVIAWLYGLTGLAWVIGAGVVIVALLIAFSGEDFFR